MLGIPGAPSRSRPSSKMTKYVECWGADKPFANITDSTLAKNIGISVSYFERILNLNIQNELFICHFDVCLTFGSQLSLVSFHLFVNKTKLTFFLSVISSEFYCENVVCRVWR